jgi:hypothetical protein
LPSVGRTYVPRRFYEIAKGGNAPIATEALARIARIYEIEAAIRGTSADARRAVRQATTAPVVEGLRTWFDIQPAAVSQKSDTAEALRYAIARWPGLTRFLDDGRVEVDSNIVERAIRPIALNRKNALFAGSDGCGEHWAILASLIETCKLIDVEPHAYLTDVITRIVDGHFQSRLDELLPWAYPATPNLKAVWPKALLTTMLAPVALESHVGTVALSAGSALPDIERDSDRARPSTMDPRQKRKYPQCP